MRERTAREVRRDSHRALFTIAIVFALLLCALARGCGAKPAPAMAARGTRG